MASEPNLTVEDLVRRWRVSPSYVRREARLGLLPHFRFGRALRFSEDGVEAYEAARRRAGAPATSAA